MIENHIGEVRLTTWRVKFHLPTNIRKAFTQFQKEASNVCSQLILQVHFAEFTWQREEIQLVRVFYNFCCQCVLRLWQCNIKVVQSLACTLVKFGFNSMYYSIRLMFSASTF